MLEAADKRRRRSEREGTHKRKAKVTTPGHENNNLASSANSHFRARRLARPETSRALVECPFRDDTWQPIPKSDKWQT